MAKKPTYEELEQRVKELEKESRERKQAVEALRESEEKYKGIFNTVPTSIILIDKDGQMVDINPYHLTHIAKGKFPKKEFIGKNIVTHPTIVNAGLFETYKKVLEGKPFDQKDVYFPTLMAGGDGYFNVKGVPFLKNHAVIGALIMHEDITERKQTEEALKESEEKYRLLVENATDAIFIAQDGVVKFPNPKTEEVIGYTKEELAKIPFIDLIHPEDKDLVFERHKKRLKGEEPPSPYSFRVISKTGEELWVQLNTVLITWEGRPATLNFLRDITEQKKLEAQFQQAQRMEAIGTLAGGIAHNFNNVLMGIQGNTSLILLDKTSDHPDYERLTNIEQGVLSGAELTKQLLGFARGGRYEVKPTDLNELIKTQNRMFGKTKREITIRGKYQDNPWTVEVDQGQIEQVLLNLYVNACQAMPRGGDLYIQTENVTLDEGYTKPFNVTPGRYVKISITDTGAGMDEETQRRIFEPFFTTQEMGVGTGLGLASVYGIIKNHDGIINVYSEKGEGSTFTIYLPASEKEIIKEEKIPERLLKGTETVLLIDDEDVIIDVGEGILKTLGYKVLIARSGKEAIELYKKNKDKIDIVILDMIMPGMGGGETYDRLKEIDPDIKVLLSSGYSINGQATEILKRGCDGFIQKPFNLKGLSQSIREVFDKE